MPALPSMTYFAIENYLRERANCARYEAHPEITTTDLKPLLYPAELHDTLDVHSKLFQGGGQFGVRGSIDGVAFLIAGRIPYPLLRNVHNVKSDEAPQIVWEVRSYLEEYTHIGYQWGKVKHLVHELNEICTSLTQMRYVFPGIVMLLDDTKNEKANDIREAKLPRSMPTLTQEIKSLCKEVTEFLAIQSLLPTSERKPRDYAISCDPPAAPAKRYI